MNEFVRFDHQRDQEFVKTLRKRVNKHFKTNQISQKANAEMFTKTVIMLALYFLPYVAIVSGAFVSPWVILGFWLIMGIGKAGIGLGVMHDANHGAYSKKPLTNRLLGLTMNIIGANAEVWKLQHNVLHHTYTNVDGIDDDLSTPSFLRFSPHQKLRPVHKYQYLYFWFFYGISTLIRVTLREFIKAVKFRNMGLVSKPGEFRGLIINLILWKVAYFTFILVVPILFSPVSAGWTVLCFFLMHFFVGSVLSLVFQTAHVLPNCEVTEVNDSPKMENSWMVHELKTTSNFAPKSRLFSWYIGGLNFQIEHHLFPNICHTHYRSISKIVKETTKEFDLPYNSYPSFARATQKHIQSLYHLGRS